jgi:hypothetical protein
MQIQKRAGRGHERSLTNRRREKRDSRPHESYAGLLLGLNVSRANIEPSISQTVECFIQC